MSAEGESVPRSVSDLIGIASALDLDGTSRLLTETPNIFASNNNASANYQSEFYRARPQRNFWRSRLALPFFSGF
jgi:hypothetical protein